MELLAARVDNVGFFRPLVPSSAHPDIDVELMRTRYGIAASYEESHAAAADALSADGGDLDRSVLTAYRALESRFDFVLVEGVDPGSTPSADLNLDARIAAHIGAPVVAVVGAPTGGQPAAAAVAEARSRLEAGGCAIAGIVVNRVPPSAVEETEAALAELGGDPVYVLPEHPELTHATVAEVAAATGASVVVGGGGLERDVRAVRVGAMSVDHFVDDVVDGTLVIVPGDRADILLASFAAASAPGFPGLAGVLLTGGYPLAPSVRRLLADAPFPVLEVEARTYAAVTAVSAVRPSLATGDERRLTTALGVFESGVDTAEIQRRIAVERPRRITPAAFEYDLMERARANAAHIVLPESEDDRVLRAAEIVLRRGIAELTLLGPPETVQARAATLGLNLDGAHIVDPQTAPQRAQYAATYLDLRRHKGVTEELAFETLGDSTYFATMMVHTGAADGMVSGAAHTTADTIRPAFEFVRARPGVSVVSSVFFMCLSDRVLVYGDCAVNPQPNEEQLADIAATSADTAARFGIDPRVALLSYSTGASGKGADVDAVRAATEIVKEARPDLPVDGPVQYDAAVDPDVAKLKLPDSPVAGRASVLIFPDLESGNVAYKAVQRSSGALAIGPVLQGLNKPVNDLSRGCTIPDIVNTVAITAVQAAGGARNDSRTRSVLRAQLMEAATPAG